MQDLRIKIHCQCCGKVHEAPRTEELGQDIEALACNFCLWCEDAMTASYREWPIPATELPEPENHNQIKLFY